MSAPCIPGLFDQGDEPTPSYPRLVSGLVPATLDTSTEATALAEKDTQRAAVYETIRAAGDQGCTDDEIQARLGLDGSSERPRRWELWKRDLIRIQEDVTRQTRTGRRAVVWVVTP